MLHYLLTELKKVCDLKTLHINGPAFIEDYRIMQSIYSHIDGVFESLFDSLQYHVLNGKKLARRATEIALEAIRNPEMQHFAEKLIWMHTSEESSAEKPALWSSFH